MPDCRIYFTSGESVEVLDAVMDEFMEYLERGGAWWSLDGGRLVIRLENITHIELYERWKPDSDDCWRVCPTRSCLVDEKYECPYTVGESS